MINTNAIRSFSDKVRALSSTKATSITLTAQDARNINHEIQTLLALLVELQNQAQGQPVEVELTGKKF